MNILLPSILFASKCLQIAMPDFSDNSIEKVVCGIRPYRDKGLRIEKEQVNDKTIIHNYGHGGSGICLSWGSCNEAVSLLMEEEENNIAILGSGIIGLTTAAILSEKGYRVRIYAEKFPPYTTSDVAPAVWGKVLVEAHGSEEEIVRLDRIQDESFIKFYSLAKEKAPLFKGVKIVTAYGFKNNKKKLLERLPKAFHSSIQKIEIDFNGIARKGCSFNTIVIDTEVYIRDLIVHLQDQGVKFIQRKINSLEEIKALEEKTLFNCTGYGAKALFNDPHIIPVKGELIYFNKRKNKNIDYFLSGPIPKAGLDIYVIPLENKLVLGGSYEIHKESLNPDLKVINQILLSTKSFFHMTE